MDGAMIGGPVVTTANPGGSGIRPWGELEAINTFPRKRGHPLVHTVKR